MVAMNSYPATTLVDATIEKTTLLFISWLARVRRLHAFGRVNEAPLRQ